VQDGRCREVAVAGGNRQPRRIRVIEIKRWLFSVPVALALGGAAHADAQTKPAPGTAQPAPAPTAPNAALAEAMTARDANLRAYVELLRSDLRAQKVGIITEMMQFTEAEDAKFWPIYREYEAELQKINDDRLGVIKDYARNYETLTDATADRLAKAALSLEDRRQAVKATYYERIKTALSPKTALRFFQVENQLLLLLDLQIASSLPVAR
jgi:hypothetical protein